MRLHLQSIRSAVLLVAGLGVGLAGCADPTASDVCALLGEPGQAVRILEVSADEPVAIGLARPGIEILEGADDRFQPEARELAGALRALEAGAAREQVPADQRAAAAGLDGKVAAACAPS